MDIISPQRGTFHRQVFDKGENIPFHYHEAPYISYVRQGGYLERIPHEEVFCKERAIVVHPSGEGHSNHFKTNSTVLSVFLEGNANPEFSERVGTLKRGVFLSPSLETLFYKMAREVHDPDPFSPLMLEGLSLEIFAEVFRIFSRNEKNAPSVAVPKVMEILNERLGEVLSLDEIAQEAGLEKALMVRDFKNVTGLTIGEYIRKIRVEKAKVLLETTKTPLCEVALEAGFYDQSHFVKVFRRETCTTPLQYRKTFQTQ